MSFLLDNIRKQQTYRILRYAYMWYITARVTVVVNPLDYFSNVLRNGGVLSLFGAHTHTLLQHLRCLLNVFLRITHDRIVKNHAILARMNKKKYSKQNGRKITNNQTGNYFSADALTCSNVRSASRNANTLAPKEWYMLLSAHGSMIFLASSKSLLKK